MTEPKFLVTLCASHISEINRLYNFENMIKSFKNQYRFAKLLISMSFESQSSSAKAKLESQSSSESLNDKVDHFIHKYSKNNIRIFKQNNAMSQFQHYKFLSEQFDTIFTNYTWCLFVDDDDYLNPIRNNTFFNLINRVKSMDEICIQNSVMMSSSWDSDISISKLNSYLKTGESYTRVVPLSNEYVTYCVKLSALKKYCVFLEKTDKIATKQCDVVLASMLNVKCKTFDTIYKNEWLYAYNQTSNHTRTCHKIGIEYYVKNYDDIFFDKLSKEFNFNWIKSYPKGYCGIYSIELHRSELEKIKNKNKKVINNKKLYLITSLSLSLILPIIHVLKSFK